MQNSLLYGFDNISVFVLSNAGEGMLFLFYFILVIIFYLWVKTVIQSIINSKKHPPTSYNSDNNPLIDYFDYVRKFIDACNQIEGYYTFEVKEVWKTNEEALNLLKTEYYGDMPLDTKDVNYDCIPDCSKLTDFVSNAHRGYFMVRDTSYSSNGTLELPEQFLEIAKKKDYYIDQDTIEENLRTYETLGRNAIDSFDIYQKNFERYKVLKTGYNGEKLIEDYIENVILDQFEGAQMFTNANLKSNADSSNEHDVIIVCTKGIFSIEIKNYGGFIELSNTGIIKISGKSVDEKNDFIIQSDNHKLNLTQVFSNTEYKKYIHTLVALANNEPRIINNSSFPIFSYKMIRSFIDSKPDVFTQQDIEIVCGIIRQHSVPAKKFPMTHMFVDMYGISASELFELYPIAKKNLNGAYYCVSEMKRIEKHASQYIEQWFL